MTILYDLIFLGFALVYLPIYLFKGKFHRGFSLRLGFIPKNFSLKSPIWIHAVSVGEIMAMRGLIEKLRRSYPLKNFVISTVTPTGNKIACSLAKEGDFVTYLPLDLSFILQRVIKKINPCIFIIAETEIWPNLITALYKSGIPIAVLNTRISDRSFRGYSVVKCLLKPILNKITIFCAQSENDCSKLIALGVSLDKIKVTGNMKFDQTLTQALDTADYKKRLGLKEGERLFVAGSTHPGEEGILLNAFRELLNKFPNLRLLLAPRHPERAYEVYSLVKRFGFKPQRVSLLSPEMPPNDVVFILDTVGELVTFYALCDVAFVGGSLVKKGGQNILEPASVEKPVIFGPYMFNFRDIAQAFLNNRGAFQVHGQKDLVARVSELLGDHQKAAQLVKHAREIILNNRGATDKNVALVREFIS